MTKQADWCNGCTGECPGNFCCPGFDHCPQHEENEKNCRFDCDECKGASCPCWQCWENCEEHCDTDKLHDRGIARGIPDLSRATNYNLLTTFGFRV